MRDQVWPSAVLDWQEVAGGETIAEVSPRKERRPWLAEDASRRPGCTNLPTTTAGDPPPCPRVSCPLGLPTPTMLLQLSPPLPPRDLNLLAFTTSPPLYNLLLRGFVTTQPHLGCSRNFLLYGPFDGGAEDFSGWVLS